MKIKYIENVFEHTKPQVFEVEYKFKSLGAWFDELIQKDREGFAPILSGRRAEWDEVPCLDDEVIFTQDLKGPIAIAIAGMFAAIGITVSAATITTVLVTTLVSALVGFALNYLFTPAIPKEPFSSSPSYQWDGVKNTIGEGTPMGVVYGKHRVGGAIIEAFIEGEKQSGNTKKSYLYALLALSEGEIDAFLTDTLTLNNQPINQFREVTFDTRMGTRGQAPLKDFNKIVRHYNIVGVELRSTLLWSYTLNGDYTNRCWVNIQAPAGLSYANDDGGTDALAIEFTVEYKDANNPADTWHLVPGTDGHDQNQWIMKAESKSAVNYTIPIEFPDTGKWKIRLNRITANRNSLRYNDRTNITAIKESEPGSLSYPNTALLGLKIKATDRLSGTMPDVSVVIRGRKLRDVRTGVVAWSNNPANIIYDLMTHRRYGLGSYLGLTQAQIDALDVPALDMESLREFADYCDEIVTFSYHDPTDGAADAEGMVTVTEKRFEYNCVFDTQTRAMDTINKICGSCRALPYWEGDKFKVVVEKESDPVQLFSMGNIVADSYQESYLGLFDIPNVLECYILDEEDDFKRTTISGMDKTRFSEPTQSKEVNLFGITKESTAKREIAYSMAKARSIRKYIVFETGIDSIVCQSGDVFLFQHQIPKYGLAGGNIKAINGKDVTLDRKVTLIKDREYTLRVRRSSDNVQVVRQIIAPASKTTNVVTIADSDTLGAIQPGDVYAFGEGLNASAGTIQAIDTTTKQVTINDTVLLRLGKQYSLRVYKSAGGIVSHVFTADASKYTSVLDLIPTDNIAFSVGDQYKFGEVYKEARPFRVSSMVRKDNKHIEITAEEYKKSIFTDDNTIRVIRRKKPKAVLGVIESYTVDGTVDGAQPTLDSTNDVYRGNTTDAPPYVDNIDLSENVDIVGETLVPCILVSFEEVDMPDNAVSHIKSYSVWYSTNEGGKWSRAGSCTQSPFRIKNAQVGKTYYVLVKPVTNYCKTNDHELQPDALDYSITISGDTGDPIPAPTDLTVTPKPFSHVLKWTNPAIPNLKYIEVWAAQGFNDRSLAERIGVVKGHSFNNTQVIPGITFYYWVRAVSNTGKFSLFTPGADTEPPVGTPGIGATVTSWDGGTFV